MQDCSIANTFEEQRSVRLKRLGTRWRRPAQQGTLLPTSRRWFDRAAAVVNPSAFDTPQWSGIHGIKTNPSWSQRVQRVHRHTLFVGRACHEMTLPRAGSQAELVWKLWDFQQLSWRPVFSFAISRGMDAGNVESKKGQREEKSATQYITWRLHPNPTKP